MFSRSVQIHEGMSGRIKLLKNGEPVNEALEPTIDYVLNPASEFDQKCGTYDLGDYVLPNQFCPETFVCDTSDKSETVQQYSECMNALNCAMFRGMTASAATDDAVALFIHQMVPHHVNAINMAKALLKLDVTPCDDITADTPDCVMNRLLRGVINSQNEQIMQMNNILKSRSFALTAESCDVTIQSSQITTGLRA